MHDPDAAIKILEAFTAACAFVATFATLLVTVHYVRNWDWSDAGFWHR